MDSAERPVSGAVCARRPPGHRAGGGGACAGCCRRGQWRWWLHRLRPVAVVAAQVAGAAPDVKPNSGPQIDAAGRAEAAAKTLDYTRRMDRINLFGVALAGGARVGGAQVGGIRAGGTCAC